MTRVDLTVRGGGIFGLSVAWEAVCRGARVRVIETVRIGAGASGGLVGALTPHTPEVWNPVKAFQLESLLRAEDWWARVAATSGLPTGYARIGRLQPLTDAAAVALAQTRAVQAETLWQGRAHWQVIPATGAAWQPASATGLMIHDTLSARISPRLGLAAVAGVEESDFSPSLDERDLAGEFRVLEGVDVEAFDGGVMGDDVTHALEPWIILVR
jgi:glycine/D-amino acid oxidase-like deaminating enzyme